MNIAVVRNTGVPANCRKAQQLADLFLKKAARLGKCRWDEVSLVLNSDSGIRSVNRTFLNHDYPTDVISFSYRPVPGEVESISGEIVVNVELAIRLGKRFKGAERELALYIAHGCDHLAGADDATGPQRRRMRARELRWVSDAAKKGLLEGLLKRKTAFSHHPKSHRPYPAFPGKPLP